MFNEIKLFLFTMYLILQTLFLSNSLLGQEEKRVAFELCELRIIES